MCAETYAGIFECFTGSFPLLVLTTNTSNATVFQISTFRNSLHINVSAVGEELLHIVKDSEVNVQG